MTTEQERDIEKLNAGRILREASRELLPFLLTLRENALAGIVQSHRGNEPAKLPAYAAELSVIDILISKITRSNRETEHREGKLYATERE